MAASNRARARSSGLFGSRGGVRYRTKNHLVLCSGLIFGLMDGGPFGALLRVTECVGVAAAMHAPLPADAPEQIGAPLADALIRCCQLSTPAHSSTRRASATVLRAALDRGRGPGFPRYPQG